MEKRKTQKGTTYLESPNYQQQLLKIKLYQLEYNLKDKLTSL